MKAAFQGEKGAYSEIAVRRYFGEGVEVVPCYSFEEVFKGVMNGTEVEGVIPIENSITGSISECYDLLYKYPLYIKGELYLKIRHCLLGKEKYKLNEIEKVISHPQALGQCSEILQKIGMDKVEVVYDTAGGAKIAAESKGRVAAIASSEAAKYYGLEIIKKDVQNVETNYTRFLVLSKSEAKVTEGEVKKSVCIEREELNDLLEDLRLNVQISKLELRPLPDKPFKYRVFIDFELSEEVRKKRWDKWGKIDNFFNRSLGEYKKGKWYLE
jgi:prephenate dehydratase